MATEEVKSGSMVKGVGSAVSNALSSIAGIATIERSVNDVVANTMPEAGNAIFRSYKRNKNRTFNDLTQAAQLASEANKEEQEIKAADAIANEEMINATSSLMRTLYSSSAAQDKSYLNTATKEQVEQDMVETNAEDLRSRMYTPSAGAIERLSVQEYFPNIGRDINVGQYAGRRVGNVSIFAAPGAVIPYSLIDARKRALAETAKAKQAAIEKILEIPNAPEQFNQQFKPMAMDEIYDALARNGNDPNKFMMDKEAVKTLYKWQTIAEDFVDVNKTIDGLLDKHIGEDGKLNSWLPDEVLDFMYDFRAGTLEDMQDYLTGKKDIADKLRYVQTFADGTKMVDERVAELLKYPRQLPMNLKKGVEINEAAVEEIDQAIKEVQGGSGYDQFMTVVKKYYDIDAEGFIGSWLDYQRYPEGSAARQQILDYFEKQIPKESLVPSIEARANDDFKYYELNKKRQWEKEDKMALWEVTLKKFEDAAINKAIVDAQAAIDKETDPDKKAKLLADTYNALEAEFGNAFKVQVDKYDKGKVYGVVTVDRATQTATATIDNRRSKIYVYERRWDPKGGPDKKGAWVKGEGKYVFFDEFKNSLQSSDPNTGTIKYGKYYPQDAGGDATGNGDAAYNKEMAQIIEQSRTGNLEQAAYEHHVQAGYTSGGKRIPVRPNNIGQYKNATDQTLMVTTLTNPLITTGDVDEGGNPIRVPSKVRLRFESDLEDDIDRQTLEVISSSKQTNTSKFGANE
jgi:hypothetical protein